MYLLTGKAIKIVRFMVILCQAIKEVIMKINEFKIKTGVSTKTARWLHDKIFYPDNKEFNKHRHFTENDVKWVLERQPDSYKERIVKINGYEDYFITESGNVFLYKRGFLEPLSPEINNGYRRVHLARDGKQKHFKISILVAKHFCPNPEKKPIVNHKDGNKLNDKYYNLEWSTVSENTQHAYEMGLAKNDSGFDDSQSIPINMFKNDGTFVRTFGSIREAVRETGFTLGHIHGILRRNAKKGTNGFYFEKLL